jgi:hypothetical protein
VASRIRRQDRLGALRSALVAVAVLVGVLAMHGLMPHSAAHADGGLSAVVDVASASGDHSHADHQHDAAHSPAPMADHGSSSSGGHTPGEGEHGHVAELCLAFLTMLLALLLAVAVWSARPTRAMVIYRRVRLRIIDLSRPAEPPCLTRLSILRC